MNARAGPYASTPMRGKAQELKTAVRLKLNLVVLILEDKAYGMIRWKQAVDHFPDWGLSFGNPDFVKYAESYGGW